MQFINTEKPYVEYAEMITPLYSRDESRLNEKVPRHRDVVFTGYKSTRCRLDLAEAGIPMDGSWTMYNLHTDFDGHDGAFSSIFEMLGIEEVNVGLDPRAKNKPSWRFVRTEDAYKIRDLCRIFGVSDYLWLSEVIAPETGEHTNGN